MKINVLELRRLAEIAFNFVDNNPLIAITENFLFSVNDEGNLAVRASCGDGGILINSSIGCPGERFSIAVPARMLLATLKELSDEDVDVVIDQNSKSFTINSKNGRFKLGCEPGADFPGFPAIKEDFSRVDTISLIDGLKVTVPVCSTDDLRYNMIGVNVGGPKDNPILYATDGFRCVRYQSGLVGLPVGSIIHRKTAARATVVLNSREPVEIAVTGDKIFFSQGGFVFFGTLIQERFPDCEPLFMAANNGNKILKIDKSAIAGSLNRVSVYSSKLEPNVKMQLTQVKLNLLAQDDKSDRNLSESIDAEFSEESFTIGFNARFLFDLIKPFSSSEISVKMNTPRSASVITGEKDSWQALIMPVAIDL